MKSLLGLFGKKQIFLIFSSEYLSVRMLDAWQQATAVGDGSEAYLWSWAYSPVSLSRWPWPLVQLTSLRFVEITV